MMPFAVLGVLLIGASLLTYLLLPDCEYEDIAQGGKYKYSFQVF